MHFIQQSLDVIINILGLWDCMAAIWTYWRGKSRMTSMCLTTLGVHSGGLCPFMFELRLSSFQQFM
jgi:hypothetical protein